MIQRQQTIYLLLISIICLFLNFSDSCLFKGVGNNKEGNEVAYQISIMGEKLGTAERSALKHFEIPVSLGLVALLSLISVFMYSNLKRQLRLVTSIYAAIIIVLINVYLLKERIGRINEITFQDLGLNWPVFLLFSLIILNFLAYRGIKKDIDLLASTDRLR